MAIGIVSDSDFDSELSDTISIPISLSRIPSSATIIDINRGRALGDVEVPESLRKIIGEDAIENGSKSTKALTALFGISDSSLSAYKNGSTSTTTYNEPDSELKNHVDSTRLKIASQARGRLIASLEQITDDKLAGAKVRDLASVAQAMSAVIKNIEPAVEQVNANQTNFVFYTPKIRLESEYDTITLNE